MPLVDFAILTALPEEFEALRRVLPPLEERSDNASIWYRTRIVASNGNNYEIVAAFQTQMGPLDSQLLTAQVIDRWDPAYIILTGIAGAFAKDVKLGDVIVSQQVYYYDPAKASSEGLKYRPQGYPSSPALVRQMEALRLDPLVFEQWGKAARDSAVAKSAHVAGQTQRTQKAQAALRTHNPEIHFGTVASGSLVVADKDKRNELLRLHGKIIGTEMEGAGVLHAAFFHRELPTPAIVIKGISDSSDKSKDQVDTERHWRELAKENAARVVLELIRRGRFRPLLTDQFRLHPVMDSPALAREVIRDVSAQGSYLAFPRLVLPQGPLTELHISAGVHSDAGPLIVLKEVVDYRGKDGQRLQVSRDVPSGRIDIGSTLLPDRIGLYLLLNGTATRVVFRVRTSNDEQTASWNPTASR